MILSEAAAKFKGPRQGAAVALFFGYLIHFIVFAYIKVF